MTKPKPADQKRKPGAPTKWTEDIPDRLVEFMQDGYSLEAFCGHIGISAETLNQWEKIHPELSEAKKKGIALSRKWWESTGRRGMLGKVKNFNAAVWIFNMKNRFGWRDQPNMEARDDIPEPTLNYAPRPKIKE